jgi:4-amino-4-deoxy-L-arabinose transferase-like glycosyltransferase
VARTNVALALLFVLLAAICAPMAPLFDPDEGYYPATAAETLRAGPFWDLRFNGSPRWDKPILSYALIQGAFRVLGESAAAARVPSALEGALLIAIVGFVVARLAGTRAGTLSAVAVGTTLGVSIFSRVAHPEIAVVLSIVTTELLLCVWLTATNRRTRRLLAIGTGVSVAYGLLAKGPVAAVLPILALSCTLPFVRIGQGSLRAGIGDAALAAGVAVGLAMPWYLAMALRHGESFLRDTVWQQNVGRYTTGAYGHRASALYVVLALLVGLLPWTALLPRAIGRVRLRSASGRETLRICMLASAVSALAFYSLSSSKLASYALVCVPPLAVLIGLALDEDLDNRDAMASAGIVTAVLLGICAVVLVAAPFAAGHLVTTRRLLGAMRPVSTDVGALLALATVPLGGLIGAASLMIVATPSAKRRVASLAAVGAVAPILILATARPVLRAMYPWEEFGRAIAARPAPVWVLHRRAPSLTFYAGRPIVAAPDRDTLKAEVDREPFGWLALTREDWAELSTSGALSAKEPTLVAERGRMVLVWFANAPPSFSSSAILRIR